MDIYKGVFEDYLRSVTESVPIWVYKLLLSSFIIGTVLIVTVNGWRKGLIYSLRLFLFLYTGLVFSSTVFFRDIQADTRYAFRPFWSYEAIKNGAITLLPEIAMNVAMFFPIGFVLGCAFRGVKWWQVLLVGLVLSILIESFQLFFGTGCCETDDVIHNLLGCIIGFWGFLSVRWTYHTIYC